MFTNEFEENATITTVMDEAGELEDVQLVIEDGGVYIRQYTEKGSVDVIWLTHKMFKDMLEAMNQSEGFFVTKYTKGG